MNQIAPESVSTQATQKFRRSPRKWWEGSTRSVSSKIRKAE